MAGNLREYKKWLILWMLVSANLSLESADLLKVGRVVRILVHQDPQGDIVEKVNKKVFEYEHLSRCWFDLIISAPAHLVTIGTQELS